MSEPMLYCAKRDWWAKFFIAPALLACIAVGAWLLYTGVGLVQVPSMLVVQWLRAPHELAIGVILIVISTALFWSLLAGRYQIAEPELVIGSGIDERRVPLSSIVDVVPSHSPFRSGWTRAPVWSRDSLYVTYLSRAGGRPSSLVVAPANQEAFLDALARAAPHLQRSSDRALHASNN
ncbi:MAG TPA: PH domain-containing protein [Pirellulales bacterium]|nr:PH domain-containing protein [Pirellulales bacterium]